MNTLLRELQDWYRSQCNGDWEHSYGVTIETLDNPGWALIVDLTDTDLQSKLFEPVCHGKISADLTEGEDWIVCKVEEHTFRGTGGPEKLQEIIATFLDWANGRA